MSETQKAAFQAADELNEKLDNGESSDSIRDAYIKYSEELSAKGFDVSPEDLVDYVILKITNKNIDLLTPNVVIDYLVSSDGFDKLLNELAILITNIKNQKFNDENKEFEVWKIHQTIFSISVDIVESIIEKIRKKKDGDPNG